MAHLIESSKNLLYDLKLLEDRSDSQVQRYLGGGDDDFDTNPKREKRKTAAFGVVENMDMDHPVQVGEVDLDVPDSEDLESARPVPAGDSAKLQVQAIQ